MGTPIGQERDRPASGRNLVAVGERLAHHHRPLPHPPPGLGRAPLGEAVEGRAALPPRVGHRELHLAERARHLHAPEGLQPGHPGHRRHPGRHVRGEGGSRPGSSGGGGGHEDVGAQREVEPVLDRAPEALDHEADPDRDRDRDHQRGDGHSGAAHRAGDRPRGQPPDGPHGRPRQGSRPPHENQRDQWGHEGETEDDREEAGEAHHQRARQPVQRARPQHGQEQARERHPGQEPARLALERAGTQGHDRLHARGLQGGGEGGQEAGADPQDRAFQGGRGGQRRLADRQDEIQVVDGAGHEADRALAQGPAETETEKDARRGGGGRFHQDQGEDLVTRHPEHAQGAKDRPAMHDPEHHRVVDEEHPHQERQQAQGRQVEGEGRGELGDGAGLLARGGEAGPRRKQPRDPGRFVPLEDQVDPGEAPLPSEKPLGRADVHHHETVERPLLLRVRGFDQAQDGPDAEE